MKALIVDDDRPSRLLLAASLKKACVQSQEAPDAESAWQSLQEHDFEILLLDFMLPGMSGLELCAKVRHELPLQRQPYVLAITGLEATQELEHALNAGVDDYLVKPFDLALLSIRLTIAQKQARANRQRSATERALAARTQILDSVLSSLPDGVVIAFKSGEAPILNPAAQKLLGKDATFPADPAEQGVYQLDRTTRYDRAQLPISRALCGEIVRDVEVCVRNERIPHGVLLSVSAVPLKDAAGALYGSVAVLRDVTQRRELEEQFRQAQKMEAVGRLAGGVAHDFNNLMLVIRGYAELMDAKVGVDGPLRKSVDHILAASQRAAEVTQQLLAFGRKQILQPRVFNLSDVVGEAGILLRRLIGEDIELRTELNNQGLVKADPGQIHQVIMNLAVNSRDAMPQGGTLTIATDDCDCDEAFVHNYRGLPPGAYVRLAVTDTGSGMTDDILQRVFEPFFTTKEKGKGTGLGLAMAYGIIKQSGGYIYAYSEPGKGARFEIYLPRCVAETIESLRPLPVPAPHGASEQPLVAAETVLLVEDDQHVRQLVFEILSAQGYALLQAGNGEEALKISRDFSARIDLLVTDVIMPGMSGRQLAEKLRLERGPLRVLYTSGYTDDAIVQHGVLENDVNFLQKPYSPSALAQKVRSILDTPLRK